MPRCALCLSNAPLCDSHIVPQFIFDYIKETSATGYLRRTTSPNKREQDGPTEKLLCRRCEGRLGVVEKWFAEKIFRPFIANPAGVFPYDGRMQQFATSLSWRALQYYQTNESLEQIVPLHADAARQAVETWRRLLLEEVPHPGTFEQHVLPFEALTAADNPKLEPNTNRYLLRAVDVDVLSAKSSAMTYVKLPFFAFFGMIATNAPRNRWQGTRIAVKSGNIMPRHFVVPAAFGEYLNGKVAMAGDALKAVSSRQQKKINAAMLANIDRTANSESFRAMKHDVNLFGRDAFLRPHSDADV